MESAELRFGLAVEEDWPPVPVECLQFERLPNGYRLCSVPLFVKSLSVDDVIIPKLDDHGLVASWTQLQRSLHTTVWLLRLRQTDEIDRALAHLRNLGCNTSSLDALGCHAVDVPPSVGVDELDACLASLDPSAVAVAFPSFRHSD